MTLPMFANAAPVAPDPLLYGVEMPRIATFFPMGHAVEIATNSSAIETAAGKLWSRYPKLEAGAPVRLRVAVAAHEARLPPQPEMPRGQEHLVSIVHGTENFAVADLAQGFSFACLTQDVAEDQSSVTWYFLEPLVYLLLAARHFSQVHASCVMRNGRAVLLCGDSGTGKTCLAYACARVGWSLVSGDATQIVRASAGRIVTGRPFSIRFRESARQLFPELQRWPVRCGPNGKPDMEIDTADLKIDVAIGGQASHVIFLNRVRGAREASFHPVPFEEAFAQLDQAVVYGHEELRRQQRRSLAQLLELPALRLTYSDLNDAERALRGLLA